MWRGNLAADSRARREVLWSKARFAGSFPAAKSLGELKMMKGAKMAGGVMYASFGIKRKQKSIYNLLFNSSPSCFTSLS